jgi:hypothetical protein
MPTVIEVIAAVLRQVSTKASTTADAFERSKTVLYVVEFE